MIDYKDIDGIKIAYALDRTISSVTYALDLIGEVFSNNCERVILKKESLPDDFFSLKTGFAGEMLQKFSNYNIKLAIVGDFDNVKSKSLSAFIYECNRGKQVFFKKACEDAEQTLKNV
jgi:hypothetical protein